MSKILIDTNILIYSIDEDSKYFKQSQTLLYDTNLELYTTSKNITEFLAVTSRLPKSNLSIQQAIKCTIDITHFINILYPFSLSYQILVDLLNKYKPIGLKIHDFEIISIGISNNIKEIATINEKDYKNISEINLYSF